MKALTCLIAATALAVPAVAQTPTVPQVPIGPGTRYFDGAPPARFNKEGFVPVLFVHPQNINAACGLENPDGLRLVACARVTKSGLKVAIMPHPAAVMHGDPYALILAHELAHVNGWSGNHEL